MSKVNLIVVGGGGFAREVLWLAEAVGAYNILGILDDRLQIGVQIGDYRVLGPISDAANFEKCMFNIAIGSPQVRKSIVDKLESLGIKKFATLVHPSVQMSKRVKIGSGSTICAGVVLTTDIEVGAHNIININSTVGHDCRFGQYCTIAPIVAISGGVSLGDCVEVGTGAALRQGVSIEMGGMLGMGGVLTKNIPANEIFVGNPAKFFKKIE